MDPLSFDDTMTSREYTYSYSKLSCVREMHHVHVFCTYMVFITGLAALITRLIPPIKFTHMWFGRAYIHFMLWATATSLLINNTGLPTGVLISFVWCLGGLSIGWIVINIHQWQVQRQALRNVQESMKVSGFPVMDLAAAIQQEKGTIAAGKTWLQRMASWKALHGALFFTSWINIAGRIFATGIETESWQCYTFPYYKPIDTVHFQGAGNHTLTPVPVTDPDYERLPWGQTGLVAWGLFLSVGPMAACFVFGAIYSLVAVRFGSGKPPAQAPLSLETYEVKEGYRTSAAMSLQEG